MRSAPPVLVPVGPFFWGRRLPLVLAVLSAVSSALAWWASSSSALQLWAFALVGLLCGIVSWAWLDKEILVPGVLHWDGEAWHWTGQGQPMVAVSVHVLWDLGSAMVLQVLPKAHDHACFGGPRYTFIRSDDVPPRWHALRCAVHGQRIL